MSSNSLTNPENEIQNNDNILDIGYILNNIEITEPEQTMNTNANISTLRTININTTNTPSNSIIYTENSIPISTGTSVYSYGLFPEDYRPSGTANVSRIDNVILNENENESNYEITYINDAEEEYECSICLNIIDNDDIAKTNCEHYFCKRCIETWLKKHRNCPNCRRYIGIKNSFNSYQGIVIYAQSYNILCIMGGLGGISYST